MELLSPDEFPQPDLPQPPPRRYKRINRLHSRKTITQFPKRVATQRADGPKPFEVRALRTELGMTKAEFAKAMGVKSHQVVLSWEDGSRVMSRRSERTFRKMQKLAPHLLAHRGTPDWSL